MLTIPSAISRARTPGGVPTSLVPAVTTGGKPQRIHWVDDHILPEQFFGPRASVGGRCPEAALMRAILEDALLCVQGRFLSMGRRGRRLAQEAEAWVLSDDTHWPFAFVAICEVLGLEPAAVREAVQRWRCDPSKTPPQKSRRAVTVPRALRSSA
ncbi:MAG: hypothetical protein FJ147_07440 [Deltaproteobacteria bacterium]|nr:hypothetical protein [Deltaproteobacteria bacterium]